jgi:hypothetical protein
VVVVQNGGLERGEFHVLHDGGVLAPVIQKVVCRVGGVLLEDHFLEAESIRQWVVAEAVAQGLADVPQGWFPSH